MAQWKSREFFEKDFLSFRGRLVLELQDAKGGWKEIPLEPSFKLAFLISDNRQSFRYVTPSWRQIPFELELEPIGYLKSS